MTDKPMPTRIELGNIGKSAKILTGKFHGCNGKIVGFANGKYDVEIDANQLSDVTGTHIEPIAPSGIQIQSGDSHIASLTSAGVAEQVAKTPEPLSELEQLRKENEDLKRQNAQLIVEKNDYHQKYQSATATAASHLAANVKLNEEKIELQRRIHDRDGDLVAASLAIAQLGKQLEEKKFHPADIEAMRQLERERDEARRDLEVSRQQVKLFAKRLKAKKSQQVEVMTLYQTQIGDDVNRKYADMELATVLNDGWKPMNITVTPPSSSVYTCRIVTLSRPVKKTPESPQRETVAEATTPVHPPLIVGYSVPVAGAPTITGGTLNVKTLEERQREGDEKIIDAAHNAIANFRTRVPVYVPRPFALGTGVQS